MKLRWLPLLAILLAPPVLAGPGGNEKHPVNVNSRYTVEKVDVEGAGSKKLSDRLREDLNRLIGRHFDQEAVNRLIERIKKELRARVVEQRLVRGSQPEMIQVRLEVKDQRRDIDAELNKLAYHSKQGLTAGVMVTTGFGPHRLGASVQSDADTLLERFAGYGLHYGLMPAGDRIRLRFDYSSFHQQWNRATLRDIGASPDVPGIYRTRDNFQPAVEITLVRGLEASVGASISRFETQFPAAHTESANAAVLTLRYRRESGGSGDSQQEFQAGYGLRAATKVLGSDFVYVRHLLDAGYQASRGEHTIGVRFAAGNIRGTAPLFERFSLGNARQLRGWSKFDVAPLGGNRMVFGSVQYGYHFFQVFYDSGSVWDRRTGAVARHSAGVGFGSKSLPFIAVAFPLKSGRMEPMFMMTTTF